MATLKTHLMRLAQWFAHSERSKERRLFGLGQFVLLLCLTPFIFSLSLYSLQADQAVASQYQFDPDRFSPLVYPDFIEVPGVHENEQYIEPARLCRDRKRRRDEEYRQPCKQLKTRLAEYHVASEAIKTAPSVPRSRPEITITEEARFSFNAFVENLALISSWQIINVPIWFLGLFLIGPCVWLCVRRKQWGLLVFGLSIPAINYLIAIAAYFTQSGVMFDWQLKQTVFAQIAWVWFLLNGRIRSRSFSAFIFLLSVFAFLPLFIPDGSALSQGFLNETGFDAWRAQMPILIFVLASLLGRLLVKGAKENYRLLKSLTLPQFFRAFGHALLLWIPIALIAVPSLFFFEVYLPKKVVNHLHAQGYLHFDSEHDFLDNALQSAAIRADDALYAWYLSLEKTKIAIREKHADLENHSVTEYLMQNFSQIVPGELKMEEKKSGVPLIGGGIDLGIRLTQASVNDAYVDRHEKMTRNLHAFLSDHEEAIKNEIVNPVADQSLRASEQAYEDGKRVILETSREAQSSLWWWINFSRAIQQGLFLFFLIICAQSLLYVFSRVMFNRKQDAFITLGDTRLDPSYMPQSRILARGANFEIQPQDDLTLYISRRFQCQGKAPNISLPQPFNLPLARLRHRAWTMNKMVFHAGDDIVRCTATQGMTFYEWTLQGGESVIFNTAYLVGFSQGVILSTLVSPRISSLLFGKILFAQATGPVNGTGKLIFMAKGCAEVITDTNATGSLPPERVIAMQQEARFHVDSELDPVNVYLSSAYIRPLTGQLLVDVDSQQGAASGLGRFCRHFILPV